jgi:hypothetical protein
MGTRSRVAPPGSLVLCLALGVFAAAGDPASAQVVTPQAVTVGKVTISGFVQVAAIF